MDPSKDKEHLLALKVMRLTKPALMSSQPLINGPLLLQDSVSNYDCVQKSVTEGLEYFALGSLLTLPQNFGNIFLGETFSCYVSIHNDSKQTCRDIFIKADLQTSSQRLTLSGANPQTTNELAPDDSIDDVIHHEVKELGTHILACAVSYSTAGGEKMYFRKFFKFHVLKPLDVKTKFYNTESDDVYLEAQIQNITPGPIYLEKVSLEPSTKYTVRDLNSPTKSVGVSDCGSTVTTMPALQNLVFGDVNCMATNDIRQYLYRLTAKPELMSDIRQLKSNTLVGKLDIVWKTTMGERGRLQTSPLQRIIAIQNMQFFVKAPGSGDIKVSVVNIPEAVAVGSSFTVDFRVTNCSERTMDLMLILQNSINSGVLWSGISNKQLGKLDPCTSTVLQLNIVAIRTGLLTMSGLRLMDMFLKRTYEHDEVAQIYVYTKDL